MEGVGVVISSLLNMTKTYNQLTHLIKIIDFIIGCINVFIWIFFVRLWSFFLKDEINQGYLPFKIFLFVGEDIYIMTFLIWRIVSLYWLVFRVIKKVTSVRRYEKLMKISRKSIPVIDYSIFVTFTGSIDGNFSWNSVKNY